MDNIDVFVDLKDGSRWSATIITLRQVEAIMARWAESGEALGGRYFWYSDGLIVRDPGISNMTQVLTGLIESDEFPQVLHRMTSDPARCTASLNATRPRAAVPSTFGGQ